jgi:RNA polymerase sigma-70 factor (ECF subfamily)
LAGHPEESVNESEKERLDNIFEEELLPHADALKTFAYHLCYDNDAANDLVQETFLKAYKALEHYQTGTNAKAWLFTILKNAYINEYRKRARRPTQVDYEEANVYRDSDDDDITGYLDLREDLFDAMMGDEVTIAINALPLDYKTVILLCDIEDFTYEEMAEILDIPIGTVRSRLFRARNMLKEKLKNYAAEYGYRDVRGDKRERNKEKGSEEE